MTAYELTNERPKHDSARFIGSDLCARRLAAGNEVVCVRSNIAPFLKEPRFESVEQDPIQPIREFGA